MINPNCVKQELYPFHFLIGNGNFSSKRKEIVHYRKQKQTPICLSSAHKAFNLSNHISLIEQIKGEERKKGIRRTKQS